MDEAAPIRTSHVVLPELPQDESQTADESAPNAEAGLDKFVLTAIIL